jgi:hypothetical protein
MQVDFQVFQMINNLAAPFIIEFFDACNRREDSIRKRRS